MCLLRLGQAKCFKHVLLCFGAANISNMNLFRLNRANASSMCLLCFGSNWCFARVLVCSSQANVSNIICVVCACVWVACLQDVMIHPQGPGTQSRFGLGTQGPQLQHGSKDGVKHIIIKRACRGMFGFVYSECGWKTSGPTGNVRSHREISNPPGNFDSHRETFSPPGGKRGLSKSRLGLISTYGTYGTYKWLISDL